MRDSDKLELINRTPGESGSPVARLVGKFLKILKGKCDMITNEREEQIKKYLGNWIRDLERKIEIYKKSGEDEGKINYWKGMKDGIKIALDSIMK